MRRLKTSIAAWSALSMVGAFWAVNAVLSYDQMLNTAYSLVLGVTIAAAVRWAPDAARAMRSGRSGSDLLIVAMFSLIFMVLIQRIWVILLRVYDRPDWLVMSPVTAFVAWMMAWAVGLALFAPDTENGAIADRKRVLVGICIFLAGLIAGIGIASSLTVGDEERAGMVIIPRLANRPICPPEQSVWASSNKRYHQVDSKYRAMVIPKWCFTSEAEAQSMGFVPAK